MFDIRNKIVVVTGGLGQLGTQYIIALRGAGAKVVSIDLDIGDSTSESLLEIQADVTDKESLRSALAAVKALWGVPDALINNAAIDMPPDAAAGRFDDFSPEVWDKTMEVNAKGVFLCCQVFGEAMYRGGSIINVSSVYGMVSPDQRIYKQGFNKPIAYCASKAAVLNITRYLATLWGGKGVRVNSLTLGGVWNRQDQNFLDAYCQRVPMQRMATEEEYNGAIIFLISDASSYMTGANLVIDGGLTAW